MTSWSGAQTNWPSLANDSEYYVDMILYTKAPLYFKSAVDASIVGNVTSCTEPKTIYKMYSNAYAHPAFVYTISRTKGGESAYVVTVSKVIETSLTKPEEIVNGLEARATKAMLVKFSTSEALGRFMYQSSLGFYAAFITRQGLLNLRAPRWSGDYNYGIHCPCTGPESTGYNPRCNVWNTAGMTGYSPYTQPFIPKPIEPVPNVYEKNFRYITDVLDEMQSLSLHSNVRSTSSGSGLPVFEVLSVNDPQTPWLNNPPVWSIDA
jgi:hypothetical protein